MPRRALDPIHSVSRLLHFVRMNTGCVTRPACLRPCRLYRSHPSRGDRKPSALPTRRVIQQERAFVSPKPVCGASICEPAVSDAISDLLRMLGPATSDLCQETKKAQDLPAPQSINFCEATKPFSCDALRQDHQGHRAEAKRTQEVAQPER